MFSISIQRELPRTPAWVKPQAEPAIPTPVLQIKPHCGNRNPQEWMKTADFAETNPQNPKTKIKTRPAEKKDVINEPPAADQAEPVPKVQTKSSKRISRSFHSSSTTQRIQSSLEKFAGGFRSCNGGCRFAITKLQGSALNFAHVKFGPAPNLNIQDVHDFQTPILQGEGCWQTFEQAIWQGYWDLCYPRVIWNNVNLFRELGMSVVGKRRSFGDVFLGWKLIVFYL